MAQRAEGEHAAEPRPQKRARPGALMIRDIATGELIHYSTWHLFGCNQLTTTKLRISFAFSAARE